MSSDDWQGPRCICGEWVAVMHTECRAMLTEEEFQKWAR